MITTTYPIPFSWTQVSSGSNLLQNPIVPVPMGKVIYLIEDVTCDESGTCAVSDERLSTNQPSGAVMGFQTNWEAAQDHTLQRILFKSIVGGWFTDASGNLQRRDPMRHPYRFLYAKDIVSMKSVQPILGEETVSNPSTSGITNVPYIQSYQVMKLSINFEGLSYQIGLPKVSGGSTSSAWNPNYMEVREKVTNQRINTPIGWYRYMGGSYDGLPAQFGTWFTQGLTYIQVTLHKIPASLIYPGGYGTTFRPTWVDNLGQINSKSIFGFPVHSLLMDSIDYFPYADWYDGQLLHDITFNMMYANDLTGGGGWNKSINPAGTFDPIQLGDTGNGPFQDCDFGITFFSVNNF